MDKPVLSKKARLRRLFLFLGSLYLVWFAVITFSGLRSDLVESDCIVIPGARVDDNGLPGPSLQGRLDRALELYEQGWSKNFVCTGGRGESGFVEAEISRQVLIDAGVPESAIALEGMSHTTWENFTFARDEMRRKDWKSCLVVTDPFHIQRCLWLAQMMELEAHPAPTFLGPGWSTWSGFTYYTTREMAAWVKHLGLWLGSAREMK